MNVGLQLYTLRKMAADNFVDMLQKVANIGYQGVEFAGYGGLSINELKHVLNELGLQAVSAHISLEELLKDDAPLEDALSLGLSYVICPWLPKMKRQHIDDYRAIAKKLKMVAEKYARHGLVVGYHNHAFEFESQSDDGSSGLEIILNEAPSLQAELDVYWLEYAGKSAVDYITRYAGRCEVIHIKDMADDEDKSFAEVGAGTMNIPAIIEAANHSGTKWMFVEQDVCKKDPLQSVTESFDYLLRLGVVGGENF